MDLDSSLLIDNLLHYDRVHWCQVALGFQVIADTRRVVEQEQQGQVERWKRLAQGRAKELEVFRLELDSILDVLRELQRQGVVIPLPEHTSTITHTYLPLRSWAVFEHSEPSHFCLWLAEFLWQN